MMKETTNSLGHTLDAQVDKFFPTKRGSLQLWQFLLHLLNNSKQDETNIIEWTRKSSAEFKLLDPEEVNIRILLELNNKEIWIYSILLVSILGCSQVGDSKKPTDYELRQA